MNNDVVVFKCGSATIRRALKVSQRQLDYWEEAGLIRASGGKGRKRELTRRGRLEERVYTLDDIRAISLVKKLRDAGLSLQKMRKAAAELQRLGESIDRLRTVLVTDGKKVEWVREDGKVRQLLAGGQMVFAAVALRGIETHLQKKLRIDEHGRPLAKDKRRRAKAS